MGTQDLGFLTTITTFFAVTPFNAKYLTPAEYDQVTGYFFRKQVTFINNVITDVSGHKNRSIKD